jgi:hypothetical protein
VPWVLRTCCTALTSGHRVACWLSIHGLDAPCCRMRRLTLLSLMPWRSASFRGACGEVCDEP